MSKSDKISPFLNRQAEGFFHKDIFPTQESLANQSGMRFGRCRNGDGLNSWIE